MVILYCVAVTSAAPVIVTPPVEQNVPYEGQAVFECLATGTPDPVYSWFKNGELITEENLPTLYFSNVQVSDRGLYHCAVNNSEGSDQSQQVYLKTTGITCKPYLLGSDFIEVESIGHYVILPSIGCIV